MVNDQLNQGFRYLTEEDPTKRETGQYHYVIDPEADTLGDNWARAIRLHAAYLLHLDGEHKAALELSGDDPGLASVFQESF